MHDDQRDHANSIAVVGMAGRFPGANNVREFWTNLCNGVECVRPFTDEELRGSGLDESVLNAPNFVNAGAPMADADCFDAAFFGYTPREAQLMDPQQRVFLECAWAAMEDAGHDPARFDGDIGVFGGIARNTYFLQHAGTYKELMDKGATYDATLGMDKDYPATRVAFQMNLHGPAMSIQTACSSSGVAIHMACQSLLNGECDMAMAGGARIQVPFHGGYLWTEGGIPSPDGHCRPFDKDAAGTVYGSGAAIVVLKRLEDALADGDHVYSIILGSAINNDGSNKAGFTAPSPSGQTDVIQTALAVADVDADSIGYVEAHGTGTAIGDPIEIAALTKAYRGHTSRSGYCAIGSLKSNLGHLDAGAGVAGLIKASLMLHHKSLVPSINYSEPNPQIDFDNSPFYVSTETRDWKASGQPRRAAVSAFGLGGTNFHAVLQEAPGAPSPAADDEDWKLVPLTAKSDESLANLVASFAGKESIPADASLASVCHTLTVGRKHFESRRVCVARSLSEMSTNMSAVQNLFARTGRTSGNSRTVAFVFPGQGSQYLQMGRGLYEKEPVFRAAMDECRELFEKHIDGDLWQLINDESKLDESGQPLLDQTWVTQPAVFAMEYCLARLWMSYGLEPDYVAGHSFGEIAAACIAGIFTLPGAVEIVAARGRLTHGAPPGAMLAVGLSEEDLLPMLPADVEIATVNTPMACVISGPEKTIESFQAMLEEKDIPNTLLNVSNGFHSSMMSDVVDEFAAVIEEQERNAPTIPVISSVTGAQLSDAEALDPMYWATQVVKPVRMIDSIGRLLETPDMLLIESGPGRALSSFSAQHPNKTRAHEAILSLRHPDEEIDDRAYFRLSLGQAWCCGVDIDLEELNGTRNCPRVSLPTYAFERRRHWLSGGTTVLVSKSVEEPADDVTSETDTETSRFDRIAAAITRTLSDLSGFPPNEIDQRKSFVELGFDSLFLTRANAEFKKLSNVEIGFRQLFDEAPSVADLATYIDSNLPEDSEFFAATTRTAESSQQEVTDSSASMVPATQRETVYRTSIFSQQHESSLAKNAPVGPWRPLATGDFGALTETQQKHLSSLIERLNSKTPSSKAYTQKHRSHLADPRTVAGFRRIWKELVYPVVVDRSQGAEVWDIDGNKYTDIAMGFGVGFLGHNLDCVIEAVREQLDKGVEIGPQHPLAGEVAERLCRMTGMDRAAFCNTGSEAVLAAIRMTRTATGRDRIAVFSGDYHGIFDEVLALRLDTPSGSRSTPVAPGIPDWAVENTLVLQHGDERSFEAIREYANELAAVIVEPVQSRHPDLQPAEYLRSLGKLCKELDVPLVLDEIITGFRCHQGGIQALWGVEADIVTYGKAIGGGFPVSVVAGKRRFMDTLDGGAWQFGDESFPEVGVTWFAGTFVRHPAALAATNAALQYMENCGNELQSELNSKTASMVSELNEFLRSHRAPVHIETFASLFHIKFFEHQEVSSLLYAHLRDNGIHVTEGRVAFLSTAHTDEQVLHFKDAFKKSILNMRAGGFLPETESDVSPPDPRRRKYPLLPAQQEIWLAASFSDGANAAFNLTNEIVLTGEIDAQRLRTCVRDLVARHEALRTSFDRDGDSMFIHSEAPFDISTADLSNLAQAEQDRAINKTKSEFASLPFDLTTAPLFRATLIRCAANKHILLMTAHHIVCDGWSTGVLLRELSDAYRNLTSDLDHAYANRFQLSDFVERTLTETYKQKKEAAIQYWTSKFPNQARSLEIAPDFERPATRSFAASRFDREISVSLLRKLRSYAKAQNTTLFHVLFTAYAISIARLTGKQEIVVGISAAQQPAEGMHTLVGHGVSLLPVKLDICPDLSAHELVRDVRSRVLDAFDHQCCSYGELLPFLELDRSSSIPPLVNTVFNLDPSMQGLDFGDIQATVSSVPRKFEIFDIFFNVVDFGEQARIECTFNQDLYEQSSIEDRLDGYLAILDRLTDSDSPAHEVVVREIGAPTEDQIIRQVKLWNQTKVDFPDQHRVDQLITTFEHSPDKVAVTSSTSKLTYGELESRSNQLANFLVAKGIGAGHVVGVYMDRTVDMIVALLAILKAGGAYLPLDPAFPSERLEFMLKDSKASGLITNRSGGPSLAFDGTTEIDFGKDSDEIGSMSVSRPFVETNQDSVAYILYTSGSTGRPKGVVVPHRCVTNFLCSMQNQPGLTDDDLLLAVTTISFDISVLEIFLPLISGATFFLAAAEETADGLRLAQLIDSSGATMLQATPSTWRLLLDSGWTGNRSLRCLCGGEALPGNLAIELKDRCSELWNLYGPTETTVWSTCFEVTEPEAPIMIGRPIANTQVYVLGKEMELLPIGVPGELYIGGEGVTLGYMNLEELTDSVFVDDPFGNLGNGKLYRTGDLVRWRNDGQLQHLGRIGSQVKVRGFRIELGEIESVLEQHPTIRNVACSAWSPGEGDNRLVAYCVTEDGCSMVPTELRKHLRQSLPDYMVPQHFEAIAEIPLTANGKIDRKSLPSPTLATSTPAYSPPESSEERLVADIWIDILGIDTVNRYDNFFDIGGHSLLAVRAAAAIERATGHRPELREFVLSDLSVIASQFRLLTSVEPTVKESRGLLSRLFRR